MIFSIQMKMTLLFVIVAVVVLNPNYAYLSKSFIINKYNKVIIIFSFSELLMKKMRQNSNES